MTDTTTRPTVTTGERTLTDLLSRVKAVRDRRLNVPPPPMTTDPDYDAQIRAWMGDIAEGGAWIRAENATIAMLRDTMHGLGEARIGPLEHAFLDVALALEDGDTPQSVVADDDLMEETLFFPYQLSVLVNRIICEWAATNLSESQWRRAHHRAESYLSHHQQRAEENRQSKARKRQQGR
jgi:hypothetical protein